MNGASAAQHEIAMLDGREDTVRGLQLSSASGASVMLFAGKRLNQPIAWRGEQDNCMRERL